MNDLKKSIRNIDASIINKCVVTLFPLIIRTIMIYKLGEEYAGLTNLFGSILGMLSITELGFGTAVTFCMYEPIARKDTIEVNALLKYYKRIYNVIGICIFVIGIAMIPFLQVLIKGECPEDINVYTLYFIYLVNLCIGYFYCGYKKALLVAGQRNDLEYTCSTKISIICYFLQMLILCTAKNYYLFIIILPISTICTNYVTAKVTDKIFPDYKSEGELGRDKKAIIYQKVKALFLNRIGTIILTSADNLVISSFMGLSILAIYNNYYSLIYTFISITFMATSAITSIVANIMIEKGRGYCIDIFYCLNFIVCSLSIICVTCFANILQDFMIIWMGDTRLLSNRTVILFCIYFYVWQSRRAVITFKDAAGMWEKDKYRPFVSGIFNLILNIILVKRIGIDGIIISTILSMLIIDIPWETIILFRDYFEKGLYFYVNEQIKLGLIAGVLASITTVVCGCVYVENTIGIVLRTALCFIIDLIVLDIVFKKNKNYCMMISYLSKIVKTSRMFTNND